MSVITKFDARQGVYRPLPNMVGGPTPVINTELDTLIGNVDQILGELYEDRNILLFGNGTFTYSGTNLTVSAGGSLVMSLNSLIPGGSPVDITLMTSASGITFSATHTLWYVVIDRVAHTSTSFTGTTLPHVNSANLEVFLIAVRLDDTTDATMRLYFRDSFTMNAGSASKFNASSGTAFDVNTILVDDNTGAVVTDNNTGNVLVNG